VKEPEPQDPASPAQYTAKVANMYRLVRLAFETDSTRSVTLMLDSVSTPVVEISGATISDGYHNLSHHGKSEAKLAQLRIIDSWHMRLLADLFGSAQEFDRRPILSGFLENEDFGPGCSHTLSFQKQVAEVLVASTTA
jgi:hypothetical protein